MRFEIRVLFQGPGEKILVRVGLGMVCTVVATTRRHARHAQRALVQLNRKHQLTPRLRLLSARGVTHMHRRRERA